MKKGLVILIFLISIVFVSAGECDNYQTLHPDWLFCSDFENGYGDWSVLDPQASLVSDPAIAFNGTSAKVIANIGGDQSFAYQLEPRRDEVYIRYYVKFGPLTDWPHHMGGMSAINPGYWPSAGTKPPGDQAFWSSLEPTSFLDGIYWHFYTYWHEMRSWANEDGTPTSSCLSAGNCYYGNSFTPVQSEPIQKDRWYCVETMLKANTPNQYDGAQAFWIDGQLMGNYSLGTPTGNWLRDSFFTWSYWYNYTPIGPFEGYNWRTDPSVQIGSVQLEWYFSEGQTPDDAVYYDNVVVSTSHIGCVDEEPEPPATPQCAEGEITSQCQCGNTNASAGLCCNAGSEMIWFDPYYKNLGGCPSGNYYYVEQNNPLASDSNPGTKDLPWAHPARGVCGDSDLNCYSQTHPELGISAGDVLLIKEGEYEVPGNYGSPTIPALNPSHSGTLGHPIIFRSYPRDKVNLTANQTVIGSAGKSHIVWDGFTLYSTCDCKAGMPVVITGNINLVPRPEIEERPDQFITDIIVMNNNIIGHYLPETDNYFGIRFDYGVNHSIIRNNYIHGFWGDNQNQGGVQLYNTYNSVFENNLFEECRIGFVHKGHGTRNIVRYNVFDRNLEAIAPVGYRNISLGNNMQYVYNNIVKNCRSGGAVVIGNTWYAKVYNNDFYNCTSGILMGIPPLTSNDISFYNNIFDNHNYPLELAGQEYIPGFLVNYNDYYQAGPFWVEPEVGSGGVSYYTFSEWQNQFNKDMNSLNVDPQFVSPGEDFHLQPSSPMWDLGMDLQDYDNDGDTSERIPAGAYITGDEVIGLINNTAVSWNPPEPPQPGSSADVNGDGVVDIRDLALSVYWQGKDNTNEPNWGWFSHLDLNGDGKIGWGDVWEIISRI